MGALFMHRCTPSEPAAPQILVTQDLFAYYQPSGFVVDAATNLVTGWRNEVDGRVLAGGGSYTPSNADFNHQPTVSLVRGASAYFDGLVVPGSPGLSITLVSKVAANAADDFWWNLNTTNGLLDLWRPGAVSIAFNTLAGSHYGHYFGSGQLEPLLVITAIYPHGNIRGGGQLYVNGVHAPLADVGNSMLDERPASGTFFLGAGPQGTAYASNYSFQGDIAACAIHRRVLTPAEAIGQSNYFFHRFHS